MFNRHFVFLCLLALTAVLASPTSSRAQGYDEATAFEGIDDWLSEMTNIRAEDFTVGIGVGVGLAPDYPGADRYKSVALPVFQVRYKDTFTLDPLGARLRVWKSDCCRLRVVVGLSESRQADQGTVVSRLPDVDRGINTGLIFEGRIVGPLAFRLNARKEIANGHGGITVSPALGVVIRDKAETYSIIPELALTWGNNRYMDAFFAVTPQGAASGLPLYDAGAGFREVSARLTTTYHFNKDWMMVGRIQASRLISDAGRSPIVRQTGSRFQGLIGTGFMYIF